MNNTVVQARNLQKYFGQLCALDHIDFEVYAGECLGLLGPNGAGKTTTLRMLLGQVIPSGGELTVLNYKLPQQARCARVKMGVVPQQDNLDLNFTVIENLVSYASYFGLQGQAVKSRLDALLSFVSLTHRKGAKIAALSGGMRRRLTLARALVNEPELIILDEPTTGLDPQARQLLWQRMRDLNAQGKTLILTTHYLEEAQRLCRRILIIDEGKILANGSPTELIERYIEPHVIEIYGEIGHRYRTQLPEAVVRSEQIGDTLFCYCEDEQVVLSELQQHPQVTFLHRRANLEDVFLKLTGRELRKND